MLKYLNFSIALCFFNIAWAGPYDPIVSRAWVGETVPGQTTATLQLNVTTVKPVTLLTVSSPAAEAIEIHSLTKHKGVLQPLVVNNLHLREHSTVIFGSKGLFLMMTGIKQQLNTGDKIPVSLVVEFADRQSKTISAVAEVKKMELSYKHYGPNEVYDHR